MNTRSEQNSSVITKKQNNTHLFMNDDHLKTVPKEIEPKNIHVLYLHNNAITKINHLDYLNNLTQLFLQWNKIQRIENLNGLKNLKKLYLGNNQINVVENLEELINLKELHIESQVLEGGETLCFDPRCISTLGPRLQLLNISNNKLSNLNELSSFKNLVTLLAKDNNFNDYSTIGEDLKQLMRIKEIDFRGNSMCKIHRYKERLIAACFKLDTIDGKPISEQTRNFLKSFDRFQSNLNIKSKSYKKVFDETGKETLNKSPDAHLAFLEAQRSAAVQARLCRQKVMESANGVVPRCFWRNKNIKITNEIIRKSENLLSDFSKSTSTIWP